MPVRRVTARYEAKSRRWLLCLKSDHRGSLLLSVDAEGRPVEPVFGGQILTASGKGPQVRGYRLSPESDAMKSDEFKKWMQANPELEITK
jgi:hypothetical protein